MRVIPFGAIDMKGKVLVTGYQGFIGSLFVPMLLKAGYHVVGLDTCFFGDDCEFFKPEFDGVQHLSKDIRQICESDLEGVDFICHLAGLSNDPLGELNEELTYAINYESSVLLARLAKKTGVKRYIYSSSCSLYGIAGDKEALTEEAAFEPRTAYAKSKALTEQAIFLMADSNFAVTSLRNATAYGISPKLRLDLVVNNLVAWAVTNSEIKIMSDGTPWRPLIHAEDIARGFLAVIESPIELINKQAFNVGMNSENFQIKEIAIMVANAVPGCRIKITKEHGSDTRTYKVDFSKIQKGLPSFKPRWRLREAIEDIVESYKKNQMDELKFHGRNFIRLKQLHFLIENQYVDRKLFWRRNNRKF